MIPTIGRIVHYSLTEHDADQVNTRRAAAAHTEVQVPGDLHRPDRKERRDNPNSVVGNDVQTGDIYPLVITRVWGSEEGSAVNGQVLLDGNDTLWVTSVSEGEGNGHWHVPPRIESPDRSSVDTKKDASRSTAAK